MSEDYKKETAEREAKKKDGYKSVMDWDGRTWTPQELRHEISNLCREGNGHLSVARMHRIDDCARWLAAWLDGYVKKNPEEEETTE